MVQSKNGCCSLERYMFYVYFSFICTQIFVGSAGEAEAHHNHALFFVHFQWQAAVLYLPSSNNFSNQNASSQLAENDKLCRLSAKWAERKLAPCRCRDGANSLLAYEKMWFILLLSLCILASLQI